MKNQSNPNFIEKFPQQIHKVEFSPFEWSQNLICIALDEIMQVSLIKFPEDHESDDHEELHVEPLRQFQHHIRSQAIAWSPDSTLTELPKNITFATAGADFSIYIFYSDLTSNDTIQEIAGHKDYINSLSFDKSGECIVSTGDDQTCRVWFRDRLQEWDDIEKRIVFDLSSPGMNVCWHKDEPGKLLVAELSGLIQLFNVHAQHAILSLDCGNSSPLISADWAPNNGIMIAAVAGPDLLVWNCTKPSRPKDVRTVHSAGGSLVRFCPHNDNYIATIGQPDHQLVITSIRQQKPLLITSNQITSGLSWHFRLPYVCCGNDRNLCFWRIVMK